MYLEALYYCYYYLLFILFKALGLLILVCFRIHAIQQVQDVVSLAPTKCTLKHLIIVLLCFLICNTYYPQIVLNNFTQSKKKLVI